MRITQRTVKATSVSEYNLTLTLSAFGSIRQPVVTWRQDQIEVILGRFSTKEWSALPLFLLVTAVITSN
jgi:hypothetical protein